MLANLCFQGIVLRQKNKHKTHTHVQVTAEVPVAIQEASP